MDPINNQITEDTPEEKEKKPTIRKFGGKLLLTQKKLGEKLRKDQTEFQKE